MNQNIAFIAFIALAFSSLTVSQPQGKYCGDIFGNSLIIDLNTTQKFANITADIFGDSSNCPNEPYLYNKTSMKMNLPSNPNDCLNKILKQYGACPCPPDILFDPKKNTLNVENTELGTIELKSC